MTVILENHKLFYAAVPKAACSSIKRMLFEVENGFAFENFRANGRRWYIHDVYPTMKRAKFPESQISEFRRIAIIREPISRFLSAYSNRVAHYGKLGEGPARRAGLFKRLRPDPDLGEFVDRLEAYMAVPDIRHHCSPMAEYLGDDPTYFDRLYDFGELDLFVADVSKTVGRELALGHFKKGSVERDRSELTTKQIAKLERFYKKDYTAFGSYF